MVTLNNTTTQKEVHFTSTFVINVESTKSIFDFMGKFNQQIKNTIKNHNPLCKDVLLSLINDNQSLAEVVQIYLQKFLKISYYATKENPSDIFSFSFEQWYKQRFTEEERAALVVDNRELFNKIRSLIQERFKENFVPSESSRFQEEFFSKTTTVKISRWNTNKKTTKLTIEVPTLNQKESRDDSRTGMPSYSENGWLKFSDFKKKYDVYMYQDAQSFHYHIIFNGHHGESYKFVYKVNKETYDMNEKIEWFQNNTYNNSWTHKNVDSNIKDALIGLSVIGEGNVSSTVVKNSAIF